MNDHETGKPSGYQDSITLEHIIGAKEVEIILLRRENARLLESLTSMTRPDPISEDEASSD